MKKSENPPRNAAKVTGLAVVLGSFALAGQAQDIVLETPGGMPSLGAESYTQQGEHFEMGIRDGLLTPVAPIPSTAFGVSPIMRKAVMPLAPRMAPASPVRSARPATVHPATSFGVLNSGAARIRQSLKTGDVSAVSRDLGRLMDGEDPPGNPDPFINPDKNDPAPEPGTPQPTVPLPDEGKSALKAMPAGTGLAISQVRITKANVPGTYQFFESKQMEDWGHPSWTVVLKPGGSGIVVAHPNNIPLEVHWGLAGKTLTATYTVKVYATPTAKVYENVTFKTFLMNFDGLTIADLKRGAEVTLAEVTMNDRVAGKSGEWKLYRAKKLGASATEHVKFWLKLQEEIQQRPFRPTFPLPQVPPGLNPGFA